MQFRLFASVGALTVIAACAPEAPAVADEPIVETTTTTAPPGPRSLPCNGTATDTDTVDAYNIAVDMVGDAQRYCTNIRAAALQWESVITEGLANGEARINPDNFCGAYSGPNKRAIDDLLIEITFDEIDGTPATGNILGQAGPCLIPSGQLPRTGIIELDSADVARMPSNDLTNLLTHEIGHILGIGTGWHAPDDEDHGGDFEGYYTADPRLTLPKAVAAWQALGGTGNVPVEDKGGQGTKWAHWREDTFDTELMTGYLDLGVANPLSALTVAGLDDLGYSADATNAQPYALPGPKVRAWSVLDLHKPAHTEPTTPTSDGFTAR